jgi:FMN phosphatase YigB (HAD superfamily)
MVKLNPEIIICDIDATITDVNRAGGNTNDSFRDDVFAAIAGMIAIKRGTSRAIARGMLEDYANNLVIWWDYNDFIADFDLEPVGFWRQLREIHQRALLPCEDAVNMVKYLYNAGRRMYIVSNNPITGCLLKLERAGLGTLEGSPYFERIFGTNITRGMKKQLPMWKRIVASFDVPASKMIMVGDNPEEDFKYPGMAGIHNSIIVRRDAVEAVLKTVEGYIQVNSLNEVRNLMSEKE